MAQIELQNEKLGILKRTIVGAVDHAPDAESWIVRFSATDISYILEGLDEVVALEAELDAVRQIMDQHWDDSHDRGREQAFKRLAKIRNALNMNSDLVTEDTPG